MGAGRLLAFASVAAVSGALVLAWLKSNERKQAGRTRYGSDFNAYQDAVY